VHYLVIRAGRQRSKQSLSAIAALLGVDLLALAIPFINALVNLAHRPSAAARAADGRAVAKVCVDANEVRRQAVGADVLDDDTARALGFVVGAVAARAVQLAGIDDRVVADRYRPAPVVLHYFVNGILGAAADDLRAGN
jgi:hypothetical protein